MVGLATYVSSCMGYILTWQGPVLSSSGALTIPRQLMILLIYDHPFILNPGDQDRYIFYFLFLVTALSLLLQQKQFTLTLQLTHRSLHDTLVFLEIWWRI